MAASSSRARRNAALAGVATGIVVVAALAVSGALAVPRHVDERDASADLLAAWERSRRGTYVVESEFRRTLEDGRTLYSPTLVVQRPPDRLTRQFGGVDGQLAGRTVTCSTEPAGGYHCFSLDEPLPSFDEQVRSEVETLATYFSTSTFGDGAPALYRVRPGAEAGCFELLLQLTYPDPPYGKFSRICFDDRTGAVRYLERRLIGATEVTEATTLRAEVTDDDLSTEQDEEFDPVLDLGDVPPPVTTPPGTLVDPLGEGSLVDPPDQADPP